MGSNIRHAYGAAALAEMKEFAGFAKGTQRYIRRSLDVGLDRRDAVRRWARDPGETARIRAQRDVYGRIGAIRAALPAGDGIEGIEGIETMMAPLVAVTAFDLGEGQLACFDSYRFLYERLIGARARPWLAGAFSGAASLPYLHPETRRSLLLTMSEAAVVAAGWSIREPVFLPDWVDKVDAALTV
jgi:hypothetical protein